jgi:putative transposase
MKASRFTEAQIITILREAETGQATIEALCRKHAIGEATFYRWRSKYGGMEASDAARLKELERENSRLKQLLAERDLEIEVMTEINAKKWYAHAGVVGKSTSP